MSKAEQERHEQAVRRRAEDLGLKLTQSGDMYVLLTETDAPLASGQLPEIEAQLAAREAKHQA